MRTTRRTYISPHTLTLMNHTAATYPDIYICRSCGRDGLTIYDMFGWFTTVPYELVVCRACVREGMEGR